MPIIPGKESSDESLLLLQAQEAVENFLKKKIHSGRCLGF
jgi:hypothetical protein